jgi:hypothetical protein
MGENLEVVWAEFSTLSLVVLQHWEVRAYACMLPLLKLKTRPRVRSVSLGLSMVDHNCFQYPDINFEVETYVENYLHVNI